MISNESDGFAAFGLSEPVLSALSRKGYSAPTPIQTLSIPRLLADSGHLVAKARTGTGKTAAFGIPLVERLSEPGQGPRALILAPTRELALQVAKELRSFRDGPYPRVTAIYGGSAFGPQLRELSRGAEIVVGTPGRVLDHLGRGSLNLSALEWLVLDEADEMLDMGFLEDVETIMDATPEQRRVALFSATMKEPILRIVHNKIGDVEIVEDAAPEEEKPAVDQYSMELRREDRLEALKRVADSSDAFHGLVFCSTKAETDELARRLMEAGYPAEALHGDLSQETRERTLRRFRDRLTTILVATDVAARGIDVERISHVINWDLPFDRESYVHRIGRTGRAGRRGVAITFVGPSMRGRLRALSSTMERVLGSPIHRMAVPSVDSVLEAAYSKAKRAILALATEDTELVDSSSDAGAGAKSASPEGADALRSRLVTELLAELGPEKALDALLQTAYADQFDQGRYAHIAEMPERSERFPRGAREGVRYGGQGERRRPEFGGSGPVRIYVAYGRRHGADPRAVVELLRRATGVPGRLVDGVEVRDYYAFATLPADAARRACEVAKRDSRLPVIRPASDERSGGERNNFTRHEGSGSRRKFAD